MALKRKYGTFKRKYRTTKFKKFAYKPRLYKRAAVKRFIKGRMLQNVSQQCYILVEPSGKFQFAESGQIPKFLDDAAATDQYDKVMLKNMADKVREKGFFVNGINFDRLLVADETWNSYAKIFRKYRIKFIKTQLQPLFCPGTDLIALTHIKDNINLNTALNTGTAQVMDYDSIQESRFKRAGRSSGTLSYNINPYHATQEVLLNKVPVTNVFLRGSSFTLPVLCSCIVNFQVIFSEQNVGGLVR